MSKSEALEIMRDCWQEPQYIKGVYCLSTVGRAIKTIRARKSSTKQELELVDHVEDDYLNIKYYS